MYIKGLKLVNFRNYKKLDLEFSNNFNIIHGNNAQGKTNIVEAIFLCASGRSHRTSKESELVNIGESAFYLRLDAKKSNVPFSIEISYEINSRKKIKINHVPVQKIGDLIGRLTAVMFSPEDLMLVKEGPAVRRRFVDITLSQLKPSYFYDLQQYTRSVMQKNSLLKQTQDKSKLIDTLEIWNNKIAEHGTRIILERKRFIQELEKIAAKKHEKLTDLTETLGVKYVPSVKFEASADADDVRQAFTAVLEKNAMREISSGISLYGPHRDDMEILINGLNAKVYGSQGQQRTTVLALKLSEIEIMKNDTGESPVLLLDDVMSELDAKRQGYLIESLAEVQTFITCTQKELYMRKELAGATLFEVENGKVNDAG